MIGVVGGEFMEVIELELGLEGRRGQRRRRAFYRSISRTERPQRMWE